MIATVPYVHKEDKAGEFFIKQVADHSFTEDFSVVYTGTASRRFPTL